MKKIMFILFLITIWLNAMTQGVNWRNMGSNKNANFYDIQKDFYTYWKDKKPGKGQGYKVFKRWEAIMLPRVYPSGNISNNHQMLGNYTSWARSNKVADRSPYGNWMEVGPLLKPIGYDAGVGRVDFVKFSPTDANTAYVSTPDGGLWKTKNLNASLPTWTTYNDFLPVIGCSDLAIAPDGMTMYLGTGSWESDKNSIGILKSVDGGETWTTTSLVFQLNNYYKITRILMHPSNPLVMMAATTGGLFRTTDGWVTHIEVPSLGFGNTVQDIKFNPGDPLIVYASGKNIDDPATNKIFWKSTDNGLTWVNINLGLPNNSDVSRVIIGVSTADVSVVYLLAGNQSGGYLGTYKSSDYGETFSTQSTTPNILSGDIPAPMGPDGSGQATHDLAIAVAPNDANKVTIGGISQYRSLDGGMTWNLLTYWYGIDPNYPGSGSGTAPYLHADVQSITYLPGSNTTIYSTCDGSVSRSADDGVTWTDISNNMRVAQQSDIALSSDDAIMIAGLQDIGNLKNEGAPAWKYIGGGDGESTFIDYTNNNNIVTSEPNGGHNFSDDGGISKYSLGHDDLPAGTEFFSPIIQDPVVPTTCYAGGRSLLYKSTNYRDAVSGNHTWTSSIGQPAGTGSILRFAVAPSNPLTIYVCKQDAISITTDGGNNWVNITGNLPVGDAFVRNIAVSNTDPLKAWIVFSGFSAGNKVFKTTDGGASWSNISAGLPNIPINVIRYRNNSNDEVYIGADIGVYVTNNALAGTWVPFMSGLANCTVNDLEIYYPTGKIRAATYGRGAWESNLYTGTPTVSLAAKVFLEGPYDIGLAKMNDGLRSSQYLPTKDPYPALGITHVMGEIEGTNPAILVNPNVDNAIVDMVFVELRDKNNASTRLFTRSALVQRDGDVVDMDGVSPLHFSNAPSDDYYVSIRHRNHLGFRTKNTVTLSGTTTNLNFTDNSVMIFGTGALKLLTTGVYGMYAGDANGDGEINAVDNNLFWRVQNSQVGYKSADFNLDGEVNAVDRNNYWKVNNSKIQQLE